MTWIGCEDKVVGAWIFGLLGVPLLGGVLLLAVCCRAARGRKPRQWTWTLTLGITGLAALSALALLAYAEDPLPAQVMWLPTAGPMTLSLGRTGLYAAAATAGAAFLVALGSAPDEKGSPWSAGLTALALAAGSVALLTGHFLARYLALEIAALCVAAAPLLAPRKICDDSAARSPQEAAEAAPTNAGSSSRPGWPRLNAAPYLILRLGDAGLLGAILSLFHAGGTLEIDPALEAGIALGPGQRVWIGAFFLLAVWVKLGGWPFHMWALPGLGLSLATQTWLYATLMPNLGLYLLVRVTPLLASHDLLQGVGLWLGAIGALVGALYVLRQVDLRSGLVYEGATQAGLALLGAASGVKAAVWLSLLLVTPLRLLRYLAADKTARAISPTGRKLAAGLYLLGGLGWSLLHLFVAWWAWSAGAPLGAICVALVAIGLNAAATARWGWQLTLHLPPAREWKTPHPARCWTALGLLGSGTLVGGFAFRPLIHHLAEVAHTSVPAVYASHVALPYVVTVAAALVALALALTVWPLSPRWPTAWLAAWQPARTQKDALSRAGRLLRATAVLVERWIPLWVARAVLSSGSFLYRAAEGGVLEGSLHQVVLAVAQGGQASYRMIEQGGLEGLLRRTVQVVLSASQKVQRWHTGRLRRNLLWAAVSLALAVLVSTLWSV